MTKSLIVDHSDVVERLYKRLYEIKNKALEPDAIYLGFNWLRALDEIARLSRKGYYGERPDTFCDVPLYELAGHHDHFYIAIKEPK